MNIDCIDCEHCYSSPGYKIMDSYNYPCSALGHYLPGDEPGYKCKLEEEHINIDDGVDIYDCPKYTETDEFMCALVGTEEGCYERCKWLLYNSEEEHAYCPFIQDFVPIHILPDGYIITPVINCNYSDWSCTDEEKNIINLMIMNVILIHQGT